MSVKFFGQYLIEKKLISQRDLLRAIDLQDQHNLRFGDLVLKHKLMTSAQISEVHRAQRRTDLQFGELAVKMGYLTEEQVQHLLHLQRSTHLFIGQALVKLKAISDAQLSKALNEFNTKQDNLKIDKINIPAKVPHQPIWTIVADQIGKTLTRVAGLSYRTEPYSIIVVPTAGSVIAEMKLSGSVNAQIQVCLSAKGYALITDAIQKENGDDPQLGKGLDHSLLSFLNITRDNIVNKAIQQGHHIEISPAQRLKQESTISDPNPSAMGLLLPFYLTGGEIFGINIFIEQ
jgi:hypothetical protein